MTGIQYLIIKLGLFLLFVLVTSPGLCLLYFFFDYFDHHEWPRVFTVTLAFACLAYLFGLSWLANRTAQHMVFEDKTLGASVKSSLYDLQLRLAFLPIIGPIFTSRSRDVDEDERNA